MTLFSKISPYWWIMGALVAFAAASLVLALAVR